MKSTNHRIIEYGHWNWPPKINIEQVQIHNHAGAKPAMAVRAFGDFALSGVSAT